MVQNITIQLSAVVLMLVLALGFSFSVAHAHNGEDHGSDSEETAEMKKMRHMVLLLSQLVELLTEKAQMSAGVAVSDDHHEDTSENEADELAVWVEIHSNLTHAHVQEVGKEEKSFLLEDLKYTQEEEIIEAIAEKTGLSVHDIEKVIVFPSGEVDEHGDSVEEHDGHADEDVSGIHIMADGTVMWGNGSPVDGATILANGDIKLADGDVVTPAFDLR